MVYGASGGDLRGCCLWSIAGAQMMGNTKLYLFVLQFQSGNADAPERSPALEQGIWRARTIPGHRIELKAFEDHADPQDAGCARRRLDFCGNAFSVV